MLNTGVGKTEIVSALRFRRETYETGDHYIYKILNYSEYYE